MILTIFLDFSLMFISEYLKRRERDSNPRRCYPQRFSRPPHSTALPFLQKNSLEFGCKGITFFLSCKEKNDFFYLQKTIVSFLSVFQLVIDYL